MKKKDTISLILSTFFVVILFALASAIAHHYAAPISIIINNHTTLGPLLFVGMAALAIIVPLWSNLFLLPFGVVAWGPNTTAVLCILGWWIGSLVSFYIARTYQHRLLARYPSLAKYEYIDSLVSKKYEFLTLIFLRMTVPVDVLSFALGLFSARISWQQNAITTLIGIIPFAFIFSYIGTFSSSLQLEILATTTILFVVYVTVKVSNNNR